MKLARAKVREKAYTEDEEDDGTDLPYTSPEDRYHIARSQRSHNGILKWSGALRADPAMKVHIHVRHCGVTVSLPPLLQDFPTRLRNHLLSRLESRFEMRSTAAECESGRYSFADRSRLDILKDRMYHHQVLRLNYTTYDLRRSQDVINPRTHSDVMLLSATAEADDSDRGHRFVYARVIKIFHVNVKLHDSNMDDYERLDVLFVRWFTLDESAPGGFTAKRLHRLEFARDSEQQPAFGFVDPTDVIRGSHIIPAFAYGLTSELLGPSIVRDIAGKLEGSDADKDYCYQYINWWVPSVTFTDVKANYCASFVDRDMFMRYFSGGIGHRGSRRQLDTTIVVDDEELDPEWVNTSGDAAVIAPQAQRPEDLLELVPEIVNGGVREAIMQEQAARQSGREADASVLVGIA